MSAAQKINLLELMNHMLGRMQAPIGS
jgi:hypothetical protein